MKALILTLALTLSACVFVFSQDKKSVVIGTMIDKPNAILVINPPNSNQGFLLPQLTSAQRLSIAPASPGDDGLMVFDITDKSFYYWSGNAWIKGLGVKDAQVLSFDETNQTLSLSNGGGAVTLSTLKEIPPLVANQDAFLTTDGTTLKWTNISSLGDITSIVAGQGLTGGGTTGDITLKVNADGSTIGFTATDQLQLMDKAVTKIKIASEGNDKVLTTNSTGVVTWEDKSSFSDDNQGLELKPGNELSIDNGASASLNALEADGQIQGTLNNLSVVDGTITHSKLDDDAVDTNNIVNGAVTPSKISPGASNNQILTTIGGTVAWVDQSTLPLAIATDGSTVTGDGSVGNPLSVGVILPTDISSTGPSKVLVTDGTGLVNWSDQSTVFADNQGLSFAGHTLSIDNGAPANITAGGQVAGLIDNLVIQPNAVGVNELAPNSVTAAKIAAGATPNQVLVTDAGLNVQWVNQSSLAPNITVSSPTLTGNGTAGNPLTVGTITGVANITDGSVLNADIENNAITTSKIDDDAVTTTKILDESVSGNDIQDGSVGASELAVNAVTTSKIQDHNVSPIKLQPGGADQILVTNSAGTDAQWVPQSALVPNIAVDAITITGDGAGVPLSVGNIAGSNIIDGTIETSDIQDLSIGTGDLANNAVDINKLAVNSVNSSKITDGTIIGDDIADSSIQPTKLQQGAANQVLVTNGAGSQAIWVNQNTLVPNITADGATISGNGSTIPLAVNAITGTQITDGTVQTTDLEDNAVDVNKLADNSVNTNNIINESILGNDIVDGTIANADLAPVSVGRTNIIPEGSNKVLAIDGTGTVVWSDRSSFADNQNLSLSAANILSIDRGVSTVDLNDINATGPQIQGNIDALVIVDHTVTSTDIAIETIASNNILDGAIATSDIGNKQVTVTKIQQGAANEILATNGAGTDAAWINPGTLSIAGDVTGTLAATTVTKLQGRNVSNTAPTNGQTLVWNNATSTWVPAAVAVTPTSTFYSIDPSAFQGLEPSNGNNQTVTGLYEANNTFITANNDGSQIMAPIFLPHDAVIQSITVYYEYSVLLGSITVTVYRKALNGGANVSLTSQVSPLIAIGPQSFNMPAIAPAASATIDNQNFSYRILVTFTDSADTPALLDAAQRINGIRIQYQK